MTKEEALFNKLGEGIEDSVAGKLFGKPCFKVSGKAYVCFFENEMVFKLTGEAHKEALGLKDAQLFDPSKKKRPMKEWVQLPYKHSKKWQQYAAAARNYVSEKYS